MKPPRPVTCLHLALALVIGQASLLLLLRAHRGSASGGAHLALAAVELLAVVLFLVPRTLVLGARALWVVLVVAALLHLHTGEPPPPVFLVYAAGIWVVAEDAARARGQAP